MWLGQESGHSNQQKTAPKQGGAPTVLDANGNLLYDGSRSYAYDALDRLIQVTQGITTTQYGYTGDGDRLWQQTDGVTTTFTLDLNGALAQVLAQSQGSALTTVNFLPGIGQQQSGGAWTYFHADALGSVRHLSGVTGNAIGHVDYSPFGEIVNSTGMASWFGFTGEEQDGTNGLTYLRARYYDPALGRFLTPDSLIPDITNGQALNAYAYVYNDPVNLVDPSGHYIEIPDWVPNGQSLEWTLNNPGKAVKYGIRDGASNSLMYMDRWYSKPDDCNCNDAPEWLSFVYDWIANQGYQYVLSESVSAVEGIPAQIVTQSTRVNLGYAIVHKLNTVTRPATVKLLASAVTSVLGAGYIDAGFQFISDVIVNNTCLSPNQIFWRASVAIVFGVAAALAGLAAGTVAAWLLAAAGYTTVIMIGGVAISVSSIIAVTAFLGSLYATVKLYDSKQNALERVTYETGKYGE